MGGMGGKKSGLDIPDPYHNSRYNHVSKPTQSNVQDLENF